MTKLRLFGQAAGKSYLFIKLRAIGDTVVLSSSIAQLMNNHPDAEIDIIIPGNCLFAFENNPHLRRIYTIGFRKRWLIFLEVMTKLRMLRGPTYDYVLNFHADYLSACISRLIKARVRAVYNQGLKKRNLFTQVQIKGKGEVKSIIEKDYDVLRSIGETVQELFPTEIFLNPEDVKRKGDGLRSMGILSGGRKVVAMHTGASKETKKWGAGAFAELIDHSGDFYDILFIYSDFESHDIKKIRSLLSEKREKKGKLHFLRTQSLLDLALVLKHVDLFLVMDSGPKHIGVALGVPTLTLFSSEPMGEFHPYKSPLHRVIREDVPCRPNYADKKGYEWCGLKRCESMLCMKKITPGRVEKEIREFLDL